MQDVFYIDDVEQAAALLTPLRIELLKLLHQPRTCPDLAVIFDQTPQKIYYHVKALEKAGLIEKVEERRVRGTVEGYYQAKALSYWLAPGLVGEIGGERTAQDQTSLRFLLALAEDMQDDIGRLGNRSVVGQDVPSLGMSAQIYLPDGDRRAEFLEDVQTAFQHLAHKYGIRPDDLPEEIQGKTFRLILAAYPKNEEENKHE